MASSLPKKVFIQIESASEQQKNVKSAQKGSRTFATLQKTGSPDKENLVGRQPAFIAKEQFIKKTIESEVLQTPETKRKTPATSSTVTSSSQTSPPLATETKITAEDLTSDTVSESYWEILAERRRVALDESLKENQELYERIASLEEELDQSKSMLAETRSLVEVLTEMLEEKENSGADTTMTSEAGQNETADGDEN